MNKSVNDRFAAAKARVGTTKAKDIKPAPKATVKPTGKMGGGGRIGVKITKRF